MTPDELFEAKKAAKKAARRNKKEEEASLQITSLMDIVSIIVVYLLKSYGDDPVNITPASGQKIPLSRADAPIRDGSTVYITGRDITFEDEKIVQLTDDGEVDPSMVKKHLIEPLYDAMAEESDKSKQMAEMKGDAWEGRLILIGDQNMKFSTLVDVMYTAGRAEYLEYAFCVIQTS
jgi:biopolymer transport protein ExbD